MPYQLFDMLVKKVGNASWCRHPHKNMYLWTFNVAELANLDFDLILCFQKQISQDQNPRSEIAATKERLLRTLHFTPPSNAPVSPTRFCRAMLIFSSSGEEAGLLTYCPFYNTWLAAAGICLEELYVAPEYRRL
jgi:hypothetical protein